jgi:hypothetical protein
MRCLFFADRVSSLNALYVDATNREARTPTATRRDTQTIWVLTAGTLHEFAAAVDDLRAVDARSILTPKALDAWGALGALAKAAGRASSGLSELRSKAAFHCDDRELLERGIANARKRPSLTLAAGDDDTRGTVHLALGPEIVMSGLYPTLSDDSTEFAAQVAQTAKLATELPAHVQQLVRELLRALAPKREWSSETWTASHRYPPAADAPSS